MTCPFYGIREDVHDAALGLTKGLARQGFHLAAMHEYTTSAGKPLWWVLRLEGNQVDPDTWKPAKRILPLRRTENGFELKRPEFRRGEVPLYGLHRLANYPDDPLILPEGEKCADWLDGTGFVAVAWPGGAQAVERVDWSPLAKRTVFLWPDNDEPGFQAMKKVGQILAALGAVVFTIDVVAMALPPKGDAVDWWLAGGRDVLGLPLVSESEGPG